MAAAHVGAANRKLVTPPVVRSVVENRVNLAPTVVAIHTSHDPDFCHAGMGLRRSRKLLDYEMMA
jgi:hypothetical protein